jgi:hypothetical protein
VTRFPTHYVALTDFSLTSALRPRTYKDHHLTMLRWRYADVTAGGMIKVSSAGVFTIFRRGKLVAQEQVTAMALRSFLRTGWIQAA